MRVSSISGAGRIGFYDLTIVGPGKSVNGSVGLKLANYKNGFHLENVTISDWFHSMQSADAAVNLVNYQSRNSGFGLLAINASQIGLWGNSIIGECDYNAIELSGSNLKLVPGSSLELTSSSNGLLARDSARIDIHGKLYVHHNKLSGLILLLNSVMAQYSAGLLSSMDNNQAGNSLAEIQLDSSIFRFDGTVTPLASIGPIATGLQIVPRSANNPAFSLIGSQAIGAACSECFGTVRNETPGNGGLFLDFAATGIKRNVTVLRNLSSLGQLPGTGGIFKTADSNNANIDHFWIYDRIGKWCHIPSNSFQIPTGYLPEGYVPGPGSTNTLSESALVLLVPYFGGLDPVPPALSYRDQCVTPVSPNTSIFN